MATAGAALIDTQSKLNAEWIGVNVRRLHALLVNQVGVR
jgi:hypothetical protein